MPLHLRLQAAALLLLAPGLGVAAASATPWAADGVRVCTASGSQSEPVVAADGAGGVLIAWNDRRGAQSSIYVTRLTAGGVLAPGWLQNGRPLTQTSAGQYNPVIVSDGAGGALIAWVDRRNGVADAADIYAQHILANGAIAGGWPVDGLPICRDALYQGPPLMCSDGVGGAYVAAQNGRSGSKAVITVTRVTGAGLFAPGWSECGYALGDGTWHEAEPQIARDDAGGVLVVWSDWRLGGAGAPDIMSARLTAAGLPDPSWGGWVCRAAGAQSNPVVTSDGAGGAVIAWQDGRAGTGDDIYALRFAKSGAIAVGWPLDGAPVCTSQNLQYAPRILADGLGGALVFWSDDNASLSNVTEVHGQHLGGTGAPMPSWPAGGLAFHMAPYGSILRGVVADGAGGATLAVEDASRSNGLQYDVYVDHVTGLGVLDRARVPVCLETHQQQSTALTGDGAGGAILAWQDLRDAPSGTDDFSLYAQHEGANDAALGVPRESDPSVAFALEGAWPNPSRGVFTVAFTLPDAAPAALEVVDLSGRMLDALEVGALGEGRHLVRLGDGARVSPGLCWLRLARAGRVLATRVVVLR